MWLFGGTKTQLRWVDDGRTASRHCEKCDAPSKFREADVIDRVNLFAVELFDTTVRRMVCVTCGEDHDVDEFFSAAPAAPQARAATQPTTPRRADDHRDVDDELAALKRKMGLG